MCSTMKTEWRNIKIPAEDFERHNERRDELGMTWAEYIDGEAPEYTFAREWGPVDPDTIREIVREETRQAIEEVAR